MNVLEQYNLFVTMVFLEFKYCVYSQQLYEKNYSDTRVLLPDVVIIRLKTGFLLPVMRLERIEMFCSPVVVSAFLVLSNFIFIAEYFDIYNISKSGSECI